MKKLLFFGLIGCALSTYATQPSQKAFPFTFANVQLILPIPMGFCTIPKDTDTGKPYYDMQDAIQKTSGNVVAVLFADCKEWEIRKKDNNYRLHRSGSYLFPLTGEQELGLPESMDRTAYIEGIAKHIQPAALYVTKEKLNKNMDAALKGKPYKTPRISSPFELSTVGKDANAAYFGSVTSYKNVNEEYQVAMIIFSTAVRRVPVSVNLYADDSGKPGLDRMLRIQTELAATLQKLNP